MKKQYINPATVAVHVASTLLDSVSQPSKYGGEFASRRNRRKDVWEDEEEEYDDEEEEYNQ